MARYNFGTLNFQDQQYGDFEEMPKDDTYVPPPPMHNEGIQTLVNTYAPPTDIDAQAAAQREKAAQTNLPAQNLANQQANAFNQLLVNAGVIAPPEGTEPPLPEDPVEPPPEVTDPPIVFPKDPYFDPDVPIDFIPEDWYYDLPTTIIDPPTVAPFTVEDFVNTVPTTTPLAAENFMDSVPTTAPLAVEDLIASAPTTAPLAVGDLAPLEFTQTSDPIANLSALTQAPAPVGLETLVAPKVETPKVEIPKYNYNAPDRLARIDAYFKSPRFAQD